MAITMAKIKRIAKHARPYAVKISLSVIILGFIYIISVVTNYSVDSIKNFIKHGDWHIDTPGSAFETIKSFYRSDWGYYTMVFGDICRPVVVIWLVILTSNAAEIERANEEEEDVEVLAAGKGEKKHKVEK